MLTNSDIVELIAFRHDLHRHPELSGQEEWTAAQVAAALGSVGKRRRTLRVFEIVVPAVLFAPDAELDMAHRRFVDRLLAGWSGWLLGRPRTIQADTAATPDPTFVAQLFEEFDLMLGDAGALYSYVDGAVWDCH